MTSILSLLSSLSPELRPSSEEVEAYAQFIAAREGRSRKQLSKYRHEAELQIWVSRWSAPRVTVEALPEMHAPAMQGGLVA